MRNNNQRAYFASAAVAAMALESDAPDTDVASGIVALLCNLRHLCDAEDLAFGDLDKEAYLSYIEELHKHRGADCDYASGAVPEAPSGAILR